MLFFPLKETIFAQLIAKNNYLAPCLSVLSLLSASEKKFILLAVQLYFKVALFTNSIPRGVLLFTYLRLIETGMLIA